MDIFVHDLIYHPIGSSAIRSVAFRRFIIMWMWYFFSTKMVDAIWSRKTFYTLILWCLFHFFKYRYVIIIKLVSKSASTGTSTYLNVVFSTLINRQILLDLNCSVDSIFSFNNWSISYPLHAFLQLSAIVILQVLYFPLNSFSFYHSANL